LVSTVMIVSNVLTPSTAGISPAPISVEVIRVQEIIVVKRTILKKAEIVGINFNRMNHMLLARKVVVQF
ncbi:hypothetical protein AAEH85_21950, partial [Shewanella algae]|uniref:hypothetical protein n=1 Tax=Shewanella algae TaxID=38313 RepID=UPI00313EE89A